MATKPDRKELRTFGLTLAGVCLFWAAIFWWRGRTAPIPWFLGASPVLALLAWIAPAALRPVHWFWMPISRGLAQAMTWLLLTVAFVVVFTPYGVIMRALGKDPLERKIDRARSSYWIARRDGPFDPSQLEKQY